MSLSQRFPDYLGAEPGLEKQESDPQGHILSTLPPYFPPLFHTPHCREHFLLVVIFSYITKTKWGRMTLCLQVDIFVYLVICSFLHSSLCKHIESSAMKDERVTYRPAP